MTPLKMDNDTTEVPWYSAHPPALPKRRTSWKEIQSWTQKPPQRQQSIMTRHESILESMAILFTHHEDDDDDNFEYNSDSDIEDLLVVDDDDDPETTVVRFSHNRGKILQAVNVETYMAARAMTATQERWNALTMIPSPVYCLYYLYKHNSYNNMHVLAVAIGIILHAPFSFVYHYKYAASLPPGPARTLHLSRRLDQAMIHVCSCFITFAVTTNLLYIILALLFNMDSVYRQVFEETVKPRRNKVRLLISIAAYTIPILLYIDAKLFVDLWIVLAVSFYLFGTYPLGGWSHSAFHVTAALAPPLLMQAAGRVE